MTTTEIERRLAALEAEVANLKSTSKSKNQWWNKIAGVFANNPRFEEAMRLGRDQPRSKKRPPGTRRMQRGKSSK